MSKKYYADDYETARDNYAEQGNLVINGGFEERNTFFGWEKSSGVY